MSNQNLEQCVRDSLEGYFRDLEGETPANVYDMVIRLVEKPLLEVVMKNRGTALKAVSTRFIS